MNASVGGETSIKINILSPLSMFGFATHSSELLLRSANTLRSPVIRFRVWAGAVCRVAINQLNISADHLWPEPEISPELYSSSHISPRALSPVSPESATSHLNPSEPEPFKMGELGAELRGKSDQ